MAISDSDDEHARAAHCLLNNAAMKISRCPAQHLDVPLMEVHMRPTLSAYVPCEDLLKEMAICD